MPGVIALLDACVLYPAALRDTLLRAALRDLYRPHWSAQIIDEVARNLREHRGITDEQARRLTNAMTSHFAEAAVTGYEHLIVGFTCHEKDRHVLAAAIRAQAQVIVTFKLKDFPPDSVRPHSIEAQHPDTFLIHLFHLDPEGMVGLLREQAAALKKPATPFERVLAALEQHVPGFVRQVREYLQNGAFPS
jgi:predicted nucleic acid-binding protein